MSDIVERLLAGTLTQPGNHIPTCDDVDNADVLMVEAAEEITRLRQLLSEAETREREARAINVDKIARALTGHIAGICCHKTGAVNDDPKCECRILAAAAVSALQSEER